MELNFWEDLTIWGFAFLGALLFMFILYAILVYIIERKK